MTTQAKSFSKVKDAVAVWGAVRDLLRSGDQGHIVPVVIPKNRRNYGWIFTVMFALYMFSISFVVFVDYVIGNLDTILGMGYLLLALISFLIGALLLAIGLSSAFRSVIVEIEQGTVGVYSTYGKIDGVLEPGPNYLWKPWQRVEFIVDTSTEIPYTAPVLACPTKENVPLKSIEFFLKFRIMEPIKFVQKIGASNFDLVLSSMVQDAIRQRSRQITTAHAYDLRGSDVEDMQNTLNRKLAVYGVKIIGANIPDVQLPDQYRENLATRERVAKELSSYEKEWDLIKKRRKDTIMMEIERAKKDREEKKIAVERAKNKAREAVAQMLQEKEAEAEKVRLNIESEGQAELAAAMNEAKALQSLGKAYQNNEAVLKYDLRLRALQVGQTLLEQAPRPVVVNTTGQGEQSSALSTLMLAQMLPNLLPQSNAPAQAAPPQVSLEMPSWMKERAQG